jgi:hypothetical protein
MTVTCPQFWLDSPKILVDQAAEFFPFTEHDKRCTAAALNSFTRFGIYLGVLLAIVRMEALWLLVGVCFAGFAIGAWKYMDAHGATRENFLDSAATVEPYVQTEAPIVDARDVNGNYIPDVIGTQDHTMPTAANPFMNVLISEISDNPYKKPAANVSAVQVKHELDQYFETMFASDPGDVFQRTQNQRAFVTQPSTTIPNDQAAFADWLYRTPGQSCKEGNTSACDFNTGAEIFPWREMRKLT